jgi:hypothetical protein
MSVELIRAMAKTMSEHDLGLLLRHWMLQGGEHVVFRVEAYRAEEDGGSLLRVAEIHT